MDADQLKSLQIAPRAGQRRPRSVRVIFLGVLLVTALGAYFAWPRKDDARRLFAGLKSRPADLAKVFLNQKCRVIPEAFSDKSYAGVVAEIAPEANRQKGTLQVKVQIRSPDRYLTPELSAKVDFLAQP